MDIAERVALVTGAGVGTGQAISIRLAALGAAVVLTDVSEAGTTLRRIRDAGGRAEFVPADLARPGGVRAAVDFAVSTFGGLDVLVNNAGVISMHRRQPTADGRVVVNMTGRKRPLLPRWVMAAKRQQSHAHAWNRVTEATNDFARTVPKLRVAGSCGLLRIAW